MFVIRGKSSIGKRSPLLQFRIAAPGHGTSQLITDPQFEIGHIPLRELVEGEVAGVDGRVAAHEEQVVQEPVALLDGLGVYPQAGRGQPEAAPAPGEHTGAEASQEGRNEITCSSTASGRALSRSSPSAEAILFPRQSGIPSNSSRASAGARRQTERQPRPKPMLWPVWSRSVDDWGYWASNPTGPSWAQEFQSEARFFFSLFCRIKMLGVIYRYWHFVVPNDQNDYDYIETCIFWIELNIGPY